MTAKAFFLTGTVLVATSFVLAGCTRAGPQTYDFRGKVTWNGAAPTIKRINEQKIGGVKVWMVKATEAGTPPESKQAVVNDDGTFTFIEGNKPTSGKWHVCVTWQDDYPLGPDKLKGKFNEKNSKVFCTIPDDKELNFELSK